MKSKDYLLVLGGVVIGAYLRPRIEEYLVKTPITNVPQAIVVDTLPRVIPLCRDSAALGFVQRADTQPYSLGHPMDSMFNYRNCKANGEGIVGKLSLEADSDPVILK